MFLVCNGFWLQLLHLFAMSSKKICKFSGFSALTTITSRTVKSKISGTKEKKKLAAGEREEIAEKHLSSNDLARDEKPVEPARDSKPLESKRLSLFRC
ncbi:unnamed protein product [Gongylonema pulchrum]|uniref:Secreted protein n=1 Tax=Gongylonema pulchrum TaxID=637853 RepID=A0A183DMG3_9BILA|nr:unnamed protein product [Gongylonema pulchrum]